MASSPAPAPWENRIVGSGSVSPAELQANPRNWRTHPDNQQAALASVLSRVGWVQQVVVNKRSGFVVDGHLRVALAQERGEPELPVVYVDLDDEEEAIILATFDPIGAMAARDEEVMAGLLAGISAQDDDLLQSLLDGLRLLPAAEAPALGPSLLDRFLVPPFSVLDARQGYWQERKRQWIALGIRSEIGRGENLLELSASVLQVMGPGGHEAYRGKLSPGGSPLPAAKLNAEGRTERGDGRGRRLTWAVGSGEPRDETSLKILAGGRKDEPEGGTSGTSIFDPVLCELAYRWFAPEGGLVLDPFAGGSVRGITAALLGRSYHGIDLAAGQVEANRAQWEEIGPAAPAAPTPTWYVGDSRALSAILPEGLLYDLVFTCPPYGDLERYSDDPADISTMGYSAFMESFGHIIKAAAERLRDNRFMVLVVGDFRGPDGAYRGFVADTIGAAAKAGLALYNDAVLVTAVGSLSIRAGRYFSGSRKLGKSHQNVLVFLKGDARRAHEELGPMAVPEELLAEMVGEAEEG